MTSGESVSAGRTEDPEMSKSSTTTRKKAETVLVHNPHPGEILLEDLMKPDGLSQNALARALKVPPRRINELVHGKRAVSADTDLRLARYFGLHEGFFLGLQADYDLMEQKRKLGDRLKEITPRAA
jgi:addiction module HigA family antidote